MAVFAYRCRDGQGKPGIVFPFMQNKAVIFGLGVFPGTLREGGIYEHDARQNSGMLGTFSSSLESLSEVCRLKAVFFLRRETLPTALRRPSGSKAASSSS